MLNKKYCFRETEAKEMEKEIKFRMFKDSENSKRNEGQGRERKGEGWHY